MENPQAGELNEQRKVKLTQEPDWPWLQPRASLKPNPGKTQDWEKECMSIKVAGIYSKGDHAYHEGQEARFLLEECTRNHPNSAWKGRQQHCFLPCRCE